jgi:hypothetical protein
MGQFYEYLLVFVAYWWALVPGGILALDSTLETYFESYRRRLDKIGSRATRTRFLFIITLLAVFLAGFLAWKDERNKVNQPQAKSLSLGKWDSWRADKSIIDRFREPINQYTNAHIIFFDPTHRVFAERLASALEIAGWVVNFTKTAQGPYNPHYYGGIEVKGFNRHLVEITVSVLRESGLAGVKSEIETTQLNPKDTGYERARNRVNILIGYEE